MSLLLPGLWRCIGIGRVVVHTRSLRTSRAADGATIPSGARGGRRLRFTPLRLSFALGDETLEGIVRIHRRLILAGRLAFGIAGDSKLIAHDNYRAFWVSGICRVTVAGGTMAPSSILG